MTFPNCKNLFRTCNSPVAIPDGDTDVQIERIVEVTVRKTQSRQAIVINLAAERARRRAKIQLRGSPQAAVAPESSTAAFALRCRHYRAVDDAGSRETGKAGRDDRRVAVPTSDIAVVEQRREHFRPRPFRRPQPGTAREPRSTKLW